MTIAIWIIAIVLVLANLPLVIGALIFFAAFCVCLALLGALILLFINEPWLVLSIAVFVMVIWGVSRAKRHE